MSREKWEQRQSNRRKRTDEGCGKVQKGRAGGRKKDAADEKKFRWKVRRTRRQAERQTGREAAASDRQNRTVPGGVRKRHSLLIYIRYIRVC